MLHRSFKPAKCKTSLKLAVSRIKLLRNKRDAQVKQLKRELAKLLESGQDQTARIRVEHVVREEKTMAAYELVEIYCELIAARLPIIESQKNCPIDLKEAVSSVIFATPRCSDIPELADVKKHITAKYGKEFVSAAIELRPDSGVNRLLIEKLSAKAPDGPTKIKILTAIAEEHNIKWEPKSFGETDAKFSQDLLAGPSTFEKTAYAEPYQVHVPPSVDDEKGPPNSYATSQHNPVHEASTNSYEQNASASARKASSNHSTTSGMPNVEVRSSGNGSQEIDFRDSYSENSSAFPVGGQNWNMEFKDAASAARAAAESAERANMAAKAAAEFSNRENITRQYSSGLHSSPGNRSRDEIPKENVFHDDKHLSSANVNSTFRRSSFGMHDKQSNAGEQDHLDGASNEYYSDSQNMVKHAQQASSVSSGTVGNDKPFTHSSEVADIYHHSDIFGQENVDLHGMGVARRTEEDFVTELHGDGDSNTENDYHSRHVRTESESRKASSPHLVSPSDNHSHNLNSNNWTMGNSMESSSYNDTSVAFDDSESEGDDYKFDADKNYKGQGSGLFFSSPGIKTEVDPLENTNSWSHGQNTSEKETSYGTQSHFSVVSENLTKSAVSFEREDLLPVTFDDSDDSGSDILDQIANHGALGSSSRNVENLGTDRKSLSSQNSVGSDNVEKHFEKTVSEKNYDYDDLLNREPSSTGRSFISGLGTEADIHTFPSPNSFDDTETLENSRIESGTELNYGTLKGGFRNKGYTRPPYIKNTSNVVSSSLGDSPVQNERSLPPVRTSTSFDAPVEDKHTMEVSRGNKNLGSRAHGKSSDSYSYDLVADSLKTSSIHEPRIQNEQSETKKKPSSRASVPYFDSDDSDFEDERHKQKSASVVHPASRPSRRTSASSNTGTVLSSKDAPTEAPVTRLGWKSSRFSESKNQTASPIKKSSESWAENEASKQSSEPKRSLDEDSINSSAKAQPSSSLPKTVIKDSERQKASESLNSDGGTPSKKTVHVHPKLPDYDSFAAHFMSLKKDRP